MALTFYVEDQLHQRGRAVFDDDANTFLNLARRLARAGTKVFDVIDPYADTMFNYIQLDHLCNELDLALSGDLSVAERELALLVRAAAIEARGLSGYLFLESD